MIPPAGPGTSLMAMLCCPRVWSTMLGEAGMPTLAGGGTSDAAPHRQPTQIGCPESPCSNSTHTPALSGVP